MRIAILGAGAIGSAIGALLSRTEQEVTLIGRPAHVNAIRENGLQVDGFAGAFTARVAAAEALDFRPDLALLAVKTQDVLAAVRDNLAYLNDVPIVTMQNGVRSDELVATLLPQKQIISAVVSTSATYLAPGAVTITYQGWLVVGRPFGARDTQVETVARLLDRAIPTRVSDNIQGAHWFKLMINLKNNALPALTNQTISQVYADAYLSRLAIRLMREGLLLADRTGIQLEALPDAPMRLIRLIGWLPVGISARATAARVRRVETAGPRLGSTLQSIRRGRPTEIDHLNGEVVRLGEQLGVPTPLNAKVVELVQQVGRTGQFLSAEDIRQAIETDTRARMV